MIRQSSQNSWSTKWVSLSYPVYKRLYLIYLFFSIEGGTNVDNWEFEALMNVVYEFQAHYQVGGSQV